MKVNMSILKCAEVDMAPSLLSLSDFNIDEVLAMAVFSIPVVIDEVLYDA